MVVAAEYFDKGCSDHGKKVIVTLPVLLTGGTEIQTMALVKVLAAAEYDVTVCCFYDFEPGMVVAMEKVGAHVVLLKQKWEDGPWVLLKRLVSYFRQVKPDICHVQYMAPGFIPVLAARLAGIPVLFATVHQPGHPYGKKAHLVLRSAARLCNQFICTSKSVEQSWFGISSIFDPYGQKSGLHHCTIFNAVDVDAIRELSTSMSKIEIRNKYHISELYTIGCVARLRAEKGQKKLILAFSNVLKANASVQLLMIGDGPDKNELMQLSESLGLSQNIIWLGQLEQSDVYKLYGVMDVVVVPSLFEGFGLSAAEAMAAELPVVGSRVDGLAEVIEDGVTGYLVEPSDSPALTNALIKLLSNPEQAKEFGLRGRDRVMKYFSMGRFGESMLGFYKQHLDQT